MSKGFQRISIKCINNASHQAMKQGSNTKVLTRTVSALLVCLKSVVTNPKSEEKLSNLSITAHPRTTKPTATKKGCWVPQFSSGRKGPVKNKGCCGCDQVLPTSVTATKLLTRTLTGTRATMALLCGSHHILKIDKLPDSEPQRSMHLINTRSHWSWGGGFTKISLLVIKMKQFLSFSEMFSALYSVNPKRLLQKSSREICQHTNSRCSPLMSSLTLPMDPTQSGTPHFELKDGFGPVWTEPIVLRCQRRLLTSGRGNHTRF